MENETFYEGDNQNKEIRDDLFAKLYKCENCGNFLRFDPLINKLKCDHCDTVVELAPTKKAQELIYTSLSEKEYEPWQEKAIKCNACGAVSVLAKYETTLHCPFCDATNIAGIDSVEGLKPNAILPFKVNGEKANELLKKWIKKRLFAPRQFKKQAVAKEVKGIYIPCFTFDTNTYSNYKIRYGQNYTVTVGSGKNQRIETRTRWYVDSGNFSMDFDDIQIEVSQYIDEKQKSKLGGFDTGNCVGYHSQYIAGFNSERYNQGLDASWDKAKNATYEPIKEGILKNYRYDKLDYINIYTDFQNVRYKYALVPIWMMRYEYKQKKYGCVVNGRNGKIVGKTPLSPIRITSFVTAMLAVAGVVGWLIYKFLL